MVCWGFVGFSLCFNLASLFSLTTTHALRKAGDASLRLSADSSISAKFLSAQNAPSPPRNCRFAFLSTTRAFPETPPSAAFFIYPPRRHAFLSAFTKDSLQKEVKRNSPGRRTLRGIQELAASTSTEKEEEGSHEWSFPPPNATGPGSPYTRGPRPPSTEGRLFQSAEGKQIPEAKGTGGEESRALHGDEGVPRGAPAMSLSDSEQHVLKKFGFLRRRSLGHFQNWHLRCRGQWPDFGLPVYPEVETLLPVSEPKIFRLPLKYWGEERSVSSSIAHYPLLTELFNQTVLDPIVCKLPDDTAAGVSEEENASASLGEDAHFHLPMEFVASWEPPRDRLGLGYGEVNIFEDWPSWDPAFRLQLAEVSNLTIVPQTGEFYQKFYIGPLIHGEGWTLGAALKSFALHRGPGYGVTGLKLLSQNAKEAKAAGAAANLAGALGSHEAAAVSLRQKEGAGSSSSSSIAAPEQRPSWRDAALLSLQNAAFPQMQHPPKPVTPSSSPNSSNSQSGDPPLINQLPGVEEDLLEIALNIRGVRLDRSRHSRAEAEALSRALASAVVSVQLAIKNPIPFLSARVRVKAEGPLKLLAGHIRLPMGFRVCNPEHYIATIDKGARLDFDFLIEWGRGMWLADRRGLFREEEGFNYRCFKRRPLALTPSLPEFLRQKREEGNLEASAVEEEFSEWRPEKEGFYPTGCNFGSCNRMRLAVHKLIGSRWCESRSECPDPRDQLVVEIWSKRTHTPKQILLHALYELQAAALYAKRQLLEDADGWKEEQILTGGWSDVSRALERVREIQLKGAPICELGKDGSFKFQNEEDAKLADPLIEPHPPDIDPATWLLQEQLREGGEKPVALPKDSLESARFVSEKKEKERNSPQEKAKVEAGKAEAEEGSIPISSLQLPEKALQALLQCGVKTLGELSLYSQKQLLSVPGLSESVVRHLQTLLQHRHGLDFAEY